MTVGINLIRKHKQTIEQHVDSNLLIALDQMDCYESTKECMDSYALNVQDSCLEDGYNGDEALDARSWFITKFLCRISSILKD